MTVKSLICFGFGLTASRLAKHVSLSNWVIIGTTRAPETNDKVIAKTVSMVKWPNEGFAPPAVNAVLISVPPDEKGCPVFRQHAESFGPETWVGYLSTTGVYGDLGGRWAFEETPIHPLSKTAKNRAIAESQWKETGAHIFRLPGIYGPGRSAFDRLKAGKARRIIRPGQVFSRAHVDDIADLLARSIKQPNPGRIYNVSDDKPGPPQDVIAYAADMMGVDCPPDIPLEDANLPRAAQRFYSECKRVSNARAKAELGWRPAYPTYREGLRAIHDAAST